MAASLNPVVFIHTLGLDKLVYLTPNETSKKFFCKLMGDWLACTNVNN